MRAYPEEAGKLSPLVKIIWPEHTLEELTEIIIVYLNSENSAVFAEMVNGEYAGAALCGLRHDYVEGSKQVPSDIWKASASGRNTAAGESLKSLFRSASNGPGKKAARNLPATVS